MKTKRTCNACGCSFLGRKNGVYCPECQKGKPCACGQCGLKAKNNRSLYAKKCPYNQAMRAATATIRVCSDCSSVFSGTGKQTRCDKCLYKRKYPHAKSCSCGCGRVVTHKRGKYAPDCPNHLKNSGTQFLPQENICKFCGESFEGRKGGATCKACRGGNPCACGKCGGTTRRGYKYAEDCLEPRNLKCKKCKNVFWSTGQKTCPDCLIRKCSCNKCDLPVTDPLSKYAEKCPNLNSFICPLCGESFKAPQKTRKKCDVCAGNNRRPCACGHCGLYTVTPKKKYARGCTSPHEKKCPECGEPFLGRYATKLCPDCEGLKPRPCKCGECGLMVKSKTAEYARDCPTWNKHISNLTSTRICENCGSEFEGKPNSRYCENCGKIDPHPCACGCGRIALTRGAVYAGDCPTLKTENSNSCKTPYTCEICGKEDLGRVVSRWCLECRQPNRPCSCGECGLIVSTPGHIYAVNCPVNQQKRLKGLQESSWHCTCLYCGKEFQGRMVNSGTCEECLNKKYPCKVCGKELKKIGSEYCAEHFPWTGQKEPSAPEKVLIDALDDRFVYQGMGPWEYGQPISADFLCPEKKMIIQVDGCYYHECPIHGQGHFPKKREKDAQKTAKAEDLGWTVLRFWEHEIHKELESVLERIEEVYKNLP